jgi:hypothetical protein
MKSILICSTTFLAAASLVAADKDDVASAAHKLGDADNYSWTSTVEGGQNTPAPSHFKTQKDGLIWVEMTMRDNTTEAFAKGGRRLTLLLPPLAVAVAVAAAAAVVAVAATMPPGLLAGGCELSKLPLPKRQISSARPKTSPRQATFTRAI